jgi:hypothetical protein
MIEFEDDRIALAAINAGMSREVVVDLLTALLAVELPLFGGALQVSRPVASIVFACIRGLTGPAFRRSRSAFPVLDRELADWLGHAACTTDARSESGSWRQVGVFQSNEKGCSMRFANSVTLRSSLAQPSCRAVFRRWQFAQRTSHFCISANTWGHGLRLASRATSLRLVDGSRWSKSRSTGSPTPQSTHGCSSR